MSPLDAQASPAPLASAHLEVARRLENLGIAAWQQGDGLLASLLLRRKRTQDDSGPNADQRTAPWQKTATPVQHSQALLCCADSEALRAALPHAVATSDGKRRYSLGTTAGPIDLLPIGEESIDRVLPRFGLSALAIAWRPIRKEFVGAKGALRLLEERRLDRVVGADGDSDVDIFGIAPRRYWIAARLLAEYDLEATPQLLDTASKALPSCRKRVPQGASARRELQRVLAARNPGTGLRFLRDSGVSQALFPGLDESGPDFIGDLAPDPILRWAAWLAGSSTQRAMRILRMPVRRARSIERLVRHHPIDRTTASSALGQASGSGDAGIRRIRQRLGTDEIHGLLDWRQAQLDLATSTDQTRADQARLRVIRQRLEDLADQQMRGDRVRRLALDGAAVMTLLGRGPGRHIGLALAHLAQFVADAPETNESGPLEAELRRWADQNPE